MEEKKRWSRLRKRMKPGFRSTILPGVAVLVPVVVTFLTLRLVFLWLDGFAQPLTKRVFQRQADIPGLGIVLTLVLIWLTGLLASNVLGRRLIGIGNSLLTRLPIIGSIYGPVKQFTETLVSTEKDRGFRRVVLAEYPSRGLWILGFVTGEVRFEDGKMGRCVFVPTSPNPATGWMVICPSEKVRDTRLTVEEAMQLIVSGGLVVPPSLGTLGEFSVREDAVPSLVDLEKNSE
jgi:uncharacterized membrane protein